MKRTAHAFLLGIVTCALGLVLLGVGVPSRTGTVEDRKLSRVQMNDSVRGGRVVHQDVLETIYDRIEQLCGTDEKVPQ